MTCSDVSPAVVVTDLATGAPIITEATFDAFGNLRVSEPLTLFDSKQVFDADLAHFNIVTSGGGLSTYTAQRASSILSVTAAPGDSAIRQTKRYWNYQPGKSQRPDFTFVLGAGDETARKQIGIFDEDNGVFLRQLGSSLWIVQRSDVSGAPVDDAVAQANWNIDKLDGTGPSGATLDVTKAQLMRIDFEWLGTGQVRLGFAIPGRGIVYAHRFGNSNMIASVYMRSPNLPLRFEIERIGAGAAEASLEAICCTMVSEGGQNQVGAVFSSDRGITAASIANTALRSLIAIRLKAGYLRRTVKPLGFVITSLVTNDTTLYRLLYNPARGAGTVPTWVSAHALSSVEYDVSSTQILTNGIPLVSGYAQGRTPVTVIELPTQLALGSDFAGTVPDELVIAGQASSGTNNLLAAIDWVEL